MGKKRLPTFELIAQYEEETRALHNRVERFAAEVRAAEGKVRGLKLFRDNAVKSAVNGEDNAEKIKALNEEIKEAESALELAKQKLNVARQGNSRELTLQDVEREFRAFTAAYQAEQVESLIEDLRKAKEQYAKEYLELTNALQHHEEQARAVTFLVRPNAITTLYKLQGFGTQYLKKYATISEQDNQQLSKGLIPQSMGDWGDKA